MEWAMAEVWAGRQCSAALTLFLSQLSPQRLPLSAEAARTLGGGPGGGCVPLRQSCRR